MTRPQSRKKTQGRRQIEMKLIADENARSVTFSKRRAGLFTKATELSVLCGTQISLIVFSLGGRAYSFEHPDVHSVVERFLGGNPALNLWDSVHGRRLHGTMMQQLKEQCDEKAEQLANEKRKGKEIEAALDNLPFPTMKEYLDHLGYDQLGELKEKFEKFQDTLRSRVQAQVNVSFERPKSVDVSGPSKAMNVAASQTAKKVDLSKIERDGLGDDASPISADWLKL